MEKKVRAVDTLDENTLSRLPSDEELLRKIAGEIDADTNVKHLEAVFLKIMLYKNSPAIFRAIGKTLGPEKNVRVLRNVAVLFGRKYKENSAEGITHVFPVAVEAFEASKKLDAAKRAKKRAEAERRKKNKTRQHGSRARPHV